MFLNFMKCINFVLSHNRNMDLFEGGAPRFGKYVYLPGSVQSSKIKNELTYFIWFVNLYTISNIVLGGVISTSLQTLKMFLNQKIKM